MRTNLTVLIPDTDIDPKLLARLSKAFGVTPERNLCTPEDAFIVCLDIDPGAGEAIHCEHWHTWREFALIKVPLHVYAKEAVMGVCRRAGTVFGDAALGQVALPKPSPKPELACIAHTGITYKGREVLLAASDNAQNDKALTARFAAHIGNLVRELSTGA